MSRRDGKFEQKPFKKICGDHHMHSLYRALKQYFYPFLLCSLLLGVTANTSFAQLGSAGEILRGGKNDANLLMKEYLKPFGRGFGAGLNTGWFNKAKPHKTLGFDISVRTGVALVPGSDQSFNVKDLPLQELQYDRGPTESPTISGADDPGSHMILQKQINGQTETLADFDMPHGTGFAYVASPMLQVGIGTIKETDLTLRYMPEMKVPKTDVNFSVTGIAIKHGINQWLPGGKFMPVNLTLMAGYTELNANTSSNVDPQVDSDTENPYAGQPSTWDGQSVDLTSSSFTVNALVGKSLPFISVFGGIGYESSKMTVKTPGSYPITVPNQNYDPTDPNSKKKIIDKVDEPIDLKIDGANSFRALAGFSLKLTVITITGSYTLGNYSVANLGFGISFR